MAPRWAPAALVLAALTCACGSDTPGPSSPAASARASASAGHAAARAKKKKRELVEPPVPDPEAQKAFFATLPNPVVPFRSDRIPPVTLSALENTALGEAQGMTPVGPVRAVELTPGQRASQSLAIAPGACFTFIAEGGLGVAEVDMFLTSGAASDLKVIAEDTHGGPIGVIGGAGQCFPNLAKDSLAVDLHITVRRGAGVVLVRGYRLK